MHASLWEQCIHGLCSINWILRFLWKSKVVYYVYYIQVLYVEHKCTTFQWKYVQSTIWGKHVGTIESERGKKWSQNRQTFSNPDAIQVHSLKYIWMENVCPIITHYICHNTKYLLQRMWQHCSLPPVAFEFIDDAPEEKGFHLIFCFC